MCLFEKRSEFGYGCQVTMGTRRGQNKGLRLKQRQAQYEATYSTDDERGALDESDGNESRRSREEEGGREGEGLWIPRLTPGELLKMS